MTEAQLQQQIIQLAKLYSWRVAHFRPAMTAKGWRTPVSADGQGFPDLVLVKRCRLIFAEVKSDKGRVSPEQQEWLDALRKTKNEVYLWKPKDWPEIQGVLTK